MAQVTEQILKNQDHKLKSNPFSRAGWEFLGWNTDPSAATAQYADGGIARFSEDTTLYAIWTQEFWNIIYNLNGHGSLPEEALTSYVSTDLPYFPPTLKDVPDYHFTGWTPQYLDTGSTGDQTFSANWIAAQTRDPGYITVFILDTSGSMQYSQQDYSNAVTTIFLALRDYLNFEQAYSKVVVYSGTEITNTVSTSEISELDVSKSQYATNADFWNAIKTVINGIKKAGGDEHMVTCLYYVLNDVFKKYLETGFTVGDSELRGITFIMLTDETLIGAQSIAKYDDLLSNDYSTWLRGWQDNAGDLAFPSKIPTYSSQRKTVGQNFTKAFRQMSYYYGVNLTFGISEVMSYHYNPDTGNWGYTADHGEQMETRNMPYLNRWCRTADGELSGRANVKRVDIQPSEAMTTMKTMATTVDVIDTILSSGVQVDASTWTVPASSVVSPNMVMPYEPMSKISYILGEASAFKTQKIMQPSDLYSPSNKTKIHHVNSSWFQFKFANDSLVLPVATDLSTSGQTLAAWREVGGTGQEYSPGATIPEVGEDDRMFQAVYA